MSVLVPGFKYDVFVSYAHVDNVVLPGQTSPGWVHTLVDGLKELLHQKLGRKDLGAVWMDPRLTGHMSLTPEIQDAVTHSATLLVILSEGYLQSEWCARERELFCEAARRSGGYESRIFVVQQTEIDRPRWPKEFTDRVGYAFFKKDRDDDSVRTLGMPIVIPDRDLDYFNRLDDLSRELGKYLCAMKAATVRSPLKPDAPAATLPASAITVFLAETTPDLEDQRDNIKRQLEQFNFRVLPETYYNRSPADFKAAMERDLAESVLFVQLLGPYSTPKTNDLPKGYEGLQLDLAQSANKRIMRWRDPGLDIKAVKNHETLAPDVIAAPFEDFKGEVQKMARLAVIQRPDRAPSSEEPFTLVNANTLDLSVARDMCKALRKHAIGYEIIDEKDPLQDLMDHEEYRCDALVVVYGQCKQAWAKSQLRACRQMMLRKKLQALICAVYVSPPSDRESLDFDCGRFYFFTDPSDPGDAQFQEFIQAIQAKAISQ